MGTVAEYERACEQRSRKRLSNLIVFKIISKSQSPMMARNSRPSTLASGCCLVAMKTGKMHENLSQLFKDSSGMKLEPRPARQ